MQVDTPTGPFNILGANGQEAYIICASTIEVPIPDSQSSSISAFRILDTMKFADAVSRQIVGFVGGVEGLCAYRTNTMIRKDDPNPINPPTDGSKAEEWFHAMNQHTGRLAMDAFFLKHISFAHESEYRFIWFAEGRRQEYVDIKCPAARQFCERI